VGAVEVIEAAATDDADVGSRVARTSGLVLHVGLLGSPQAPVEVRRRIAHSALRMSVTCRGRSHRLHAGTPCGPPGARLRLATPAPTIGVAAHFGAFWLAEIAYYVRFTSRRATWRELQRLHPAVRLLETDPDCRNVGIEPAAQAFHRVCGWEELRWQVVCGNWLGSGIDPSVAAWMDEGAFARHVLIGRAPASVLLAEVTPYLSASVARRLRAALRSWGLLGTSADVPGTRSGDAA